MVMFVAVSNWFVILKDREKIEREKKDRKLYKM